MRVSVTLTMDEKTRTMLVAEAAACGMERSHFAEMVLLKQLGNEGHQQSVAALTRRLAVAIAGQHDTVLQRTS